MRGTTSQNQDIRVSTRPKTSRRDRRIDSDTDGMAQPRAPNRQTTMGDLKPKVPKRQDAMEFRGVARKETMGVVTKPRIPQHNIPQQEFALPAVAEREEYRGVARKETMGVVTQPQIPQHNTDQQQEFALPAVAESESRKKRGKSKKKDSQRRKNRSSSPKEVTFDKERAEQIRANEVVQEFNVAQLKQQARSDKEFSVARIKHQARSDSRALDSARREISFQAPKSKRTIGERLPSTESKIDEVVFRPQMAKKGDGEEISFQAPQSEKRLGLQRLPSTETQINRVLFDEPASNKEQTEIVFNAKQAKKRDKKPKQTEEIDFVKPRRKKSERQMRDPSASDPQLKHANSDKRVGSERKKKGSKSRLGEKKESKRRTRRQSSEPSMAKERSKTFEEKMAQPQFYFSEPLREEKVCAARFLVASTSAEQKLYESTKKMHEPSTREVAAPPRMASERQQDPVAQPPQQHISYSDEESTVFEPTAPEPSMRANMHRRHHSDISLDPTAREEVERPGRPPPPKRKTKEMGALQSFRLPSSGESVAPAANYNRRRAKEDDGLQYAKYFKMLAVGIPYRAVKHHMALDYLDPDLLDNYRYHRLKWRRRSDISVVYDDILETDHATYYKMLSAGVPVEAVKQRMDLEGLDPESLDLELYNKTKSRQRAFEGDEYDEGEEDAEYAKYFNMLGRNMIMKDVKEIMQQDGLDASILDNYQYKFVDRNGREVNLTETIVEGSDEDEDDDEEEEGDYDSEVQEASSVEHEWDEEDLVEADEDEAASLGKYFMMLSIGVPMQAVKQHVYQDGIDPDLLHQYKYARLDWEITEEEPEEDYDEIWEGELAKFYKMLSAGVPKEGVYQRMSMEGWDPDSLDVEKLQRAKRHLRKSQENELNAEDKKHAKYFNLLARGITMGTVRSQMEKDGLDPDVLDSYQYKPL